MTMARCRIKWMWRVVTAVALCAVIVPGWSMVRGADEGAAENKEDPVMLFSIVKDGKWGYMDKTGKVAVEPQYQLAMDFHEGLACVGLKSLRGYIDRTGTLVIPLQFGLADRFSEGLAVVSMNTRMWGEHVQWYKPRKGSGFCDRTGKVVVGIYAHAAPFSEGLIWTSYKIGYVGRDGKKVEYEGDQGSPFSEGMAAVAKGSLWGYIDRTMKLKIEPKYVGARPFSEGLAAVANSDTPPPKEGLWKWLRDAKLTWGYVDKSGNLVIEIQFDDARRFSEGRAPVRKGDKWGYIDKTGKVIVEPAYDYAWEFSEGKGRVMVGKKHGYVDAKGKMVIEPSYDAAWEFSKGLARVGVGDGEGYINHKGEYVWEPTQ